MSGNCMKAFRCLGERLFLKDADARDQFSHVTLPKHVRYNMIKLWTKLLIVIKKDTNSIFCRFSLFI